MVLILKDRKLCELYRRLTLYASKCFLEDKNRRYCKDLPCKHQIWEQKGHLWFWQVQIVSLGTTTAPASSKHSMADPIAVSNWNTAGVLESLGFTVFLFFIRGSLSTPPDASRVACRQKKTLESSVFEQSRQTRLVSNWLVFVCKIYVLDYYSWIGSISVSLCEIIVYRMKSSDIGWIKYQR